MPIDKHLLFRFLWVIASVVVSILAFQYVKHNDIIYFIRLIPNITGLLLTGVLTSLAIIFGLLGIDELTKIQNLEKKSNKNLYNSLINDIKVDVYLIIASVACSTLVSVFATNDNSLPITISTTNYIIYSYGMLFILDVVILVISLIVVYDIIMALLNTFELRYEISKIK